MWQTFLGLLIDIQEWNLSWLWVPSEGGHSGPLPGPCCLYWEGLNTLTSWREHPRPQTPAAEWPGKLRPEVGTSDSPRALRSLGGVWGWGHKRWSLLTPFTVLILSQPSELGSVPGASCPSRCFRAPHCCLRPHRRKLHGRPRAGRPSLWSQQEA